MPRTTEIADENIQSIVLAIRMGAFNTELTCIRVKRILNVFCPQTGIARNLGKKYASTRNAFMDLNCLRVNNDKCQRQLITCIVCVVPYDMVTIGQI